MNREVISVVYSRSLEKSKSKQFTLMGKLDSWFNTPLGRYCPHTGRHLASGEIYKIITFSDGVRETEVVTESRELSTPWYLKPSGSGPDWLTPWVSIPLLLLSVFIIQGYILPLIL